MHVTYNFVYVNVLPDFTRIDSHTAKKKSNLIAFLWNRTEPAWDSAYILSNLKHDITSIASGDMSKVPINGACIVQWLCR